MTRIDLISDSIVATINLLGLQWTTRVLSSKPSGFTTLPHAELQQLQKGFSATLQMECLVCLYPDEIRALLVTSLYDVKASFFHDHFVVQYSEQGSNGRTAEAVMLNWVEGINDCASGTDVASIRVCVCVCVCVCMRACMCV